jgi:hypothetical protein
MNFLGKLFATNVAHDITGFASDKGEKCSVCLKTTDQILEEHNRRNWGSSFDPDWTNAICPACKKVSCFRHAIFIKDPQGNRVPACPTHKLKLSNKL